MSKKVRNFEYAIFKEVTEKRSKSCSVSHFERAGIQSFGNSEEMAMSELDFFRKKFKKVKFVMCRRELLPWKVVKKGGKPV